MQVLTLCGDKYHPAKNMRKGLSWLENAGFQLDWLEDAEDWRADKLDAYPLVILAKSNHMSAEADDPWMTMEIQTAFVNYVRQGGGLLAIHSGIADYDESARLRKLLGGVFVHHPPQCPVTISPKLGHPVTTGSYSFTLPDEHYFVVMDDIQADVFLTSTSKHGQQPAGWIRTEGKGRVGVLTPGHNPAVWHHTSYQTLVANLLHWCVEQS